MKHLSITFALLILTCVPAVAQQAPDPEFNTSVENPAYKKDGPRVLFDEAHHNFHTTEGRYKPFVDLMLNDGYRVVRTSAVISDAPQANTSDWNAPDQNKRATTSPRVRQISQPYAVMPVPGGWLVFEL